MSKITSYKQFFAILNDVRYKTNEYFSHGNKLGQDVKKVPTGRLHFFREEGLVTGLKELECGKDVSAYVLEVEDEAVERFHPNTINNKEFWQTAKENFPLLSVCGSPSSTIAEVNKNTLSLPTHFKFLHFIDSLISVSEESVNFLEIGFGHGNILNLLNDLLKYTGIDYTIPHHLKKYKNLLEIDVSGIPELIALENYYDVIYSCNVLQHCSQQDRFEYFEQAARVLKPGGHFLFSTFVWSEENKNEPYWGVRDSKNRYYTHFFSQLTEVDTDVEIQEKLYSLGFIVNKLTKWGNCWGYITEKL
jgi:SAM-dependent methyltransferase